MVDGAKPMTPEKTGGGVAIAHPGHLLVAYQAALALQEAGLLDRFETGFYFKNGWLARHILALFPQGLSARLSRQLQRRTHAGLSARRVRTHPLAELIYLLAVKTPFLRRWSGRALQWRNEHFDAIVARLVRRERPRAVICYDSCASKAFEAAEQAGAVRILDQVVGHIGAGVEMLAEERRLHPDFADSIPDDIDTWALRRCSAEALAADRVIAASEYVRDTLVAHGVAPSRIAICPYGVDIERFSPAPRDGERPFRILFVGQLSQRKGIKYLIEAFKALELENAELILMGGVVGSGDYLKPYEGIFTHIRHVPYAELPRYYRMADIFVYPSLHEGSALAIYEALASGLPVIATHNAGSVARDGVDGFIVPIRDIEALKEKILLLYRDKALRENMSIQARMRSESYTWQAYRQRLAGIVRDEIEGGAA